MSGDYQHVGSANRERVTALANYLIHAFEEYMAEEGNAPLPFLDAFMGIHNFHKAIILDIADREEMVGERRAGFLKMAADTFDRAMREAKERR